MPILGLSFLSEKQDSNFFDSKANAAVKSVQVHSIQKLNQKMIQILYKRIVQKNLPQSILKNHSKIILISQKSFHFKKLSMNFFKTT